MWVACHGDERVIDSVGFDYLASVGHVERTRDLSFLEQCTFFCLDRQIIFWAPNCIRIVEYEIAKTTVETKVCTLSLLSLFPSPNPRVPYAPNHGLGNSHHSNQ